MKSRLSFSPALAEVLLGGLLLTLLVAGGASRGDAPAQAIVRGAAFVALMLVALLAPRPELKALRAPALLLACMVALPALQLIPLPPALWKELPGRDPVVTTDTILGAGAMWRPLSLTPGATLNALLSLVVPVAMLVLLALLKPASRGWLGGAVLVIAGATMAVALVQVAGNRFEQPLIAYTYEVSGTFANRNHFALFLAIGCLVAPVWALASQGGEAGWRGMVAAGLVLIFVLGILASGSRAGMAAGGIAVLVGPLLVRDDLKRLLRGYPRWLAPALAGAMLVLVAAAIMASIASQRAVSINRLLEADISADMRSRALPTVFEMLRNYAPVGAGFGSFDAVFRIHEPFALLKPTYFNQAHDDLLGVVLDGGLPAAALLLAAAAWWARATFAVWRDRRGMNGVALAWGRLGSAIIAIVFAASIVDYPARTPLVMAVLVLGGAWLAWGAHAVRDGSSLPTPSGRV